MLDKRCLALLNVINTECLNSGYRVFSFEELALAMPKYFGVDASEVQSCLNALVEREYISIKYQDEVEVLTCPLPKGRLVFEKRIEEQTEKIIMEKKYFLYSFIGGLSGGVIATIVFIVLSAIFGGI